MERRSCDHIGQLGHMLLIHKALFFARGHDPTERSHTLQNVTPKYARRLEKEPTSFKGCILAWSTMDRGMHHGMFWTIVRTMVWTMVRTMAWTMVWTMAWTTAWNMAWAMVWLCTARHHGVFDSDGSSRPGFDSSGRCYGAGAE